MRGSLPHLADELEQLQAGRVEQVVARPVVCGGPRRARTQSAMCATPSNLPKVQGAGHALCGWCTRPPRGLTHKGGHHGRHQVVLHQVPVVELVLQAGTHVWTVIEVR